MNGRMANTMKRTDTDKHGPSVHRYAHGENLVSGESVPDLSWVVGGTKAVVRDRVQREWAST